MTCCTLHGITPDVQQSVRLWLDVRVDGPNREEPVLKVHLSVFTAGREAFESSRVNALALAYHAKTASEVLEVERVLHDIVLHLLKIQGVVHHGHQERVRAARGDRSLCCPPELVERRRHWHCFRNNHA